MKPGTRILVRNDNNEKWIERTLITLTDQGFVCVTAETEQAFNEGKDCSVTTYQFGKQLPDVFYKWKRLNEDGTYIIETLLVTDAAAEAQGYVAAGYIKDETSKTTWSD